MPAWITRIEVLVAIVAFALLAVLSVPRGVDAAISSEGDALSNTHEMVQNAIDRYAMDHHAWPANDAEPTNTATACKNLLKQLTLYTNDAGQTNTTRDEEYCYGPYLDPTGDGAELLSQLAADATIDELRCEYDPTNGRLRLSDANQTR